MVRFKKITHERFKMRYTLDAIGLGMSAYKVIDGEVVVGVISGHSQNIGKKENLFEFTILDEDNEVYRISKQVYGKDFFVTVDELFDEMKKRYKDTFLKKADGEIGKTVEDETVEYILKELRK